MLLIISNVLFFLSVIHESVLTSGVQKFSYTNLHIVTFNDDQSHLNDARKSALVIMSSELCILCFTNPILNALN